MSMRTGQEQGCHGAEMTCILKVFERRPLRLTYCNGSMSRLMSSDHCLEFLFTSNGNTTSSEGGDLSCHIFLRHIKHLDGSYVSKHRDPSSAKLISDGIQWNVNQCPVRITETNILRHVTKCTKLLARPSATAKIQHQIVDEEKRA